MYYNTCIDQLIKNLQHYGNLKRWDMSTEFRTTLSTSLECLLESLSMPGHTPKKIIILNTHIHAILPLVSMFTKASLWSYAHTAWSCFTCMVDQAEIELIEENAQDITREILQQLIFLFQLYDNLPPPIEPLQFAFLTKDMSIFLLNLADKALSNDSKAHILITQLLSPSSVIKDAKDKKTRPFQSSYWLFTRCLLRFCSLRFPLSYAKLRNFSAHQQDFFGQSMIHTARCAAEALHILHILMLNEHTERLSKLQFTFSNNNYFKKDISQLYNSMLHCPDGLLQSLLTEYFSRCIQDKHTLWLRFLKEDECANDVFKNVDLNEFEQSLQQAIKQWNKYGNKMTFLSDIPIIMRLNFRLAPSYEDREYVGTLELNEFACIFEARRETFPLFIEVPFWACNKAIDFTQSEDTSVLHTAQGYFTVGLSNAALQWVSRNWVGFVTEPSQAFPSGQYLDEFVARFSFIEPSGSLILDYLISLSKKNHIKLNHSRSSISSAAMTTTAVIQQTPGSILDGIWNIQQETQKDTPTQLLKTSSSGWTRKTLVLHEPGVQDSQGTLTLHPSTSLQKLETDVSQSITTFPTLQQNKPSQNNSAQLLDYRGIAGSAESPLIHSGGANTNYVDRLTQASPLDLPEGWKAQQSSLDLSQVSTVSSIVDLTTQTLDHEPTLVAFPNDASSYQASKTKADIQVVEKSLGNDSPSLLRCPDYDNESSIHLDFKKSQTTSSLRKNSHKEITFRDDTQSLEQLYTSSSMLQYTELMISPEKDTLQMDALNEKKQTIGRRKTSASNTFKQHNSSTSFLPSRQSDECPTECKALRQKNQELECNTGDASSLKSIPAKQHTRKKKASKLHMQQEKKKLLERHEYSSTTGIQSPISKRSILKQLSLLHQKFNFFKRKDTIKKNKRCKHNSNPSSPLLPISTIWSHQSFHKCPSRFKTTHTANFFQYYAFLQHTIFCETMAFAKRLLDMLVPQSISDLALSNSNANSIPNSSSPRRSLRRRKFFNISHGTENDDLRKRTKLRHS